MRNLRLYKKDYSCRTQTEWPIKYGRVLLVPCKKCLVQLLMSSVYVYTGQGTRKTRPCLAGHPVHALQIWKFPTSIVSWLDDENHVTLFKPIIGRWQYGELFCETTVNEISCSGYIFLKKYYNCLTFAKIDWFSQQSSNFWNFSKYHILRLRFNQFARSRTFRASGMETNH